LVTDGGTQRLAVGYIKDDQLAQLPQNPDEWRPWQSRPSTREQSVPVWKDRGGFVPDGTENTPVARTGTLPVRLPTQAERQHRRRLDEEVGSKNEVLRRAWGGVVNAEGKTPKTKRWLDEALAEVVT
jgi:hypothetical protein